MTTQVSDVHALARVILLVEGDARQRASMARGLGKLPGVRVVCASCVAEAKQVMGTLEPQLLVTDLDLPDGAGVELLGELASQGLRIPVVLLAQFARPFAPRREELRVYEKPKSLEHLRRIVEPKLSEPPVPRLLLVDCMQLAAIGRCSVLLETRRGGELHGSILVRGGEVWSASDAYGSGMAALRRLVLDVEGMVTCRAPTEPAGKRTIDGAYEPVLVRAAQMLAGHVDPFEDELVMVIDGGPNASETRLRTPGAPPKRAREA